MLKINRLREVGMPADYVNKLARMFQDIKVSEDLNQQFKEQYRSSKGSIAGLIIFYYKIFTSNFMFIIILFYLFSELKHAIFADSINIKILNAGAWARGSERVTVSLPLELEDYIPEVEDFYKKKHSGRKLQWYHHMSNGTVSIHLIPKLSSS